MSTVIREIAPGLVTFSRPFRRFGAPIGGRSTAIRLSSGDVFLIASTQLDQATKETIESLGKVKYIIAIDAEHTIFVESYQNAYPEAKLIGVETLDKRKPHLRWDHLYTSNNPPPFSQLPPDISTQFFPSFINKDLAILHKPSRTLLVADLLWNLPAREQNGLPTDYKNWFHSLMSPGTRFQRAFLWLASIKDGKAMSRDAKVVDGWDFNRIIPCHGDVIETGGKEAWRSTYTDFLK
ncbi:uncharacterized protein EI90DRAFT_2975088 [Cantharellus anzutake]|uniref:uncharacterized protein n=1 Tax=Cantharellus anzutake TaxID=1750568 RepID=UPI001906411C|nr:uncharacterized protein EI90DRAFT_2975088 [Cantharellus anzutake]KAF8327438.1 hypothetical protein EI90DRAFT_2975088 [Cantharellus anzutake]